MENQAVVMFTVAVVVVTGILLWVSYRVETQEEGDSPPCPESPPATSKVEEKLEEEVDLELSKFLSKLEECIESHPSRRASLIGERYRQLRANYPAVSDKSLLSDLVSLIVQKKSREKSLLGKMVLEQFRKS